MKNKHEETINAAQDFYYAVKAAIEKYHELQHELQKAESKNLFGDFRKIKQQMNSNIEYRNKLVGDLYEKLEEAFSEPDCSE